MKLDEWTHTRSEVLTTTHGTLDLSWHHDLLSWQREGAHTEMSFSTLHAKKQNPYVVITGCKMNVLITTTDVNLDSRLIIPDSNNDMGVYMQLVYNITVRVWSGLHTAGKLWLIVALTGLVLLCQHRVSASRSITISVPFLFHTQSFLPKWRDLNLNLWHQWHLQVWDPGSNVP